MNPPKTHFSQPNTLILTSVTEVLPSCSACQIYICESRTGKSTRHSPPSCGYTPLPSLAAGAFLLFCCLLPGPPRLTSPGPPVKTERQKPQNTERQSQRDKKTTTNFQCSLPGPWLTSPGPPAAGKTKRQKGRKTGRQKDRMTDRERLTRH